MTGRLVSLKEAAAISGLSIASYKAGVLRGHFPGPIMPYRKIHVQALHDAIDRLAGYMPDLISQENDAYDFEIDRRKVKSDADYIGKRSRSQKASE